MQESRFFVPQPCIQSASKLKKGLPDILLVVQFLINMQHACNETYPIITNVHRPADKVGKLCIAARSERANGAANLGGVHPIHRGVVPTLASIARPPCRGMFVVTLDLASMPPVVYDTCPRAYDMNAHVHKKQNKTTTHPLDGLIFLPNLPQCPLWQVSHVHRPFWCMVVVALI